jgi:hypothetical protein
VDHYYGFRLVEFISMAALSVKDEREYRADFRRRQIEFVTSLTNLGDERCTYEIRLISQPDPGAPARGSVELFLLGRLVEATDEQHRAHASQLLRLITSQFPEYSFAPLDEVELGRTLAPFPVVTATRIMRRVGIERLDTLGTSPRRPEMGFHASRRSQNLQDAGSSAGTVTHIYPFLSTLAPFSGFYKLLLLEPGPTAVSLRLRPSTLKAEEAACLEKTIAQCERYLQAGVLAQSEEAVLALNPTLREKAGSHQQHATRMLFGLRDNAALLSVTVFSCGMLSPFVVETLGSLITEPAGGADPGTLDSLSKYLAGGYQLLAVAQEDAERSLTSLVDSPTPATSLPGHSDRLFHLFDSFEAATVFKLPPVFGSPLPGATTREWKRPDPPRTLSQSGVVLGTSVEAGAGRPVRIETQDRLRHAYLVGQTGTGKSTMLQTMILDDIRSGRGLCLLDPHGDLYRSIVGRIPDERVSDVILVDPTDVDHPVGINLLEFDEESQRHFIVQEFTSIVTRLMRDTIGDAVNTMMGPMFFQHVRMNLLLVMSDPDRPGTMLDFYRIFQKKDYWKKWLPLRLGDPILTDWVDNVLPRVDYGQQGSEGASMGSYVSSKFESFIFDPMLRNIFLQQRSSVRFREAMDTGKIILVNLAKGELSEANSRFFGMVIMAKLQAAAMSRSIVPSSQRSPFYLYIDEFQSIATENFVSLLSEARKFGLGLVLANQFVAQLDNEKIMSSVFGNVGALVSFRLGNTDAERMEKETAPFLGRQDFLNLPNWHAYMAPIIDGSSVPPFVVHTIREDSAWSADVALQVAAASRSSYGRNRAAVEESVSTGD